MTSQYYLTFTIIFNIFLTSCIKHGNLYQGDKPSNTFSPLYIYFFNKDTQNTTVKNSVTGLSYGKYIQGAMINIDYWKNRQKRIK